MFVSRRGPVPLIRRHFPLILHFHRRCTTQATEWVVSELKKSGVWAPQKQGKAKRRSAKANNGDKQRVNVISESLCRDITDYVGPSLARHRGCDIIDINPGAGIWSKRLAELLQPRTHIMMEPDALYRPILEKSMGELPTQTRPVLLDSSGLVWDNLREVLNGPFLAQQSQTTSGDAPVRNDTLLVTGNLAFHPPRRFKSFPSVAILVLFQLLSSIRAASLFQRYGLVRMLLWVHPDDKRRILPRAVQARHRMAVDGELSADWITEVAGPTEDGSRGLWARAHELDVASGKLALERMKEAGIKMPTCREPDYVEEAREATVLQTHGPLIKRPFMTELRDLEAAYEAGDVSPGSEDMRRLRALRSRVNRDSNREAKTMGLLSKRSALVSAHKARAALTAEVMRDELEWNDEIGSLNNVQRGETLLMRDNMHVLFQPSPVLHWDRRQYEPMAVKKSDFFPEESLSLLDIQPKAMHPLIRRASQVDRSGDVFELITAQMLQFAAEPVSRALETVWPGAAEGVLPRCPSLRDPAQGGSPIAGEYGELTVRTLNEVQWLEILEAWMKWDFRPAFAELVGRVGDGGASDDGATVGAP
jgi:mitochondrial transcription factor 1